MPIYDDSDSAYLTSKANEDGKFKGYISYFRFSTGTTATSNFVPVTTLVDTAPTANTLVQFFDQDIVQKSPLITANASQISMNFVKQPLVRKSKNYYLSMDYKTMFSVNDVVQISVGNQFTTDATITAIYNNDITFDTIANLPIDNTGQITITNKTRSVVPKSFRESVIEPITDARTAFKSNKIFNRTVGLSNFFDTNKTGTLGQLNVFAESYLPGDYPNLVANVVANTEPLYETIQWYTDDNDAITFTSRSSTVFYFNNSLTNDFATNNQIKILDGYSTINLQVLAGNQHTLTISNDDFANIKTTYNLTIASNIASVFPQASVQDFVTPSNPRDNLFVQQRRPWTYKSSILTIDKQIASANTLARIETLNFTVTKPLYASVPDKSIYFSASNLDRNLDLYGRRGSEAFTIPGTYLWVAPADVTTVSVVAIGGGGGGSNYSDGGGGGGLGWRNNIPVTPGQLYTVRVGAGGAGADASRQLSLGYNGSDSWFINSGTVAGLGGTGGGRQTGNPGGGFLGDGGGWGGAGGTWTGLGYRAGAGGGGAGGFTSNGGRGGDSHTLTSVPTQATVSLDGGGGGSGAYNSIYTGNYSGSAGGGGGGTGLATGNLRVGITTIVNEGLNPLAGTLQYWTPKTTFYMDQWGGLGPGTAHGHTPNTAFILSIPNLPTHDKIRYQFYWHTVDSLDEETNYLEIDGVRYLQFIKNFYGPGATVINLCQSFTFVTNNTYSYSPWGGNSFGNNGYYIVDTGWIDHSSSSISINHFNGLDGGSSDEAVYISHATFQISNGFQAIKSPVIVPQQNELFDIEYLVVAGGGGGGSDMGGGGGAGGFRTSVTGATSGGNTAPESLLTTSTSSKLIITVGAGGLGAPAGAGTARGSNGSNSSIISSSIGIVSLGGGGGASNHDGSGNPAGNGGSGGGASGGAQAPNGGSGGSGGYGGGAAGVGTARQGFNGSFGIYSWYPGGGGGAGGPGSTNVANGGPGLSSGILGTTVFWAGGGAGAGYSGPGGNGGIGGGGGGAVGTTVGGIGYNNGFGGGGGSPNSQTNTPGGRAGVNTGGGGGGGAHYNSNNSGGAGGSGIVILRYPATYYVIADPGLSVYTIAVDGKRVSVFTAGTGSISFTTTPPLTVDYLVVAGGGGGGAGEANVNNGGGGGAGGLLTGNQANLKLSKTYTITVGGGGASTTSGSNSSIILGTTVIAIGGGNGGYKSPGVGGNGGSGGGGSSWNGVQAGGSGTSGQGNSGGSSSGSAPSYGGGGGGGAGGIGGTGTGSVGGAGGIGANSAISGSLVTYAGGGGGSATTSGTGGAGGLGGGGTGGSNPPAVQAGTAGLPNTGGGGGGSNSASGIVLGPTGGSGVVILRYPAAYSIVSDPGLSLNTIVLGPDKVSTFTAGTGNIIFNQLPTITSILAAPDLLVTTSGIVVDYLVVAGGGGGGGYIGGGGGGGGLRTSAPQATASGGNSPLEPSLNLANGELYTVVVGAGGPGGANPSNPYFSAGFGRGSNGSISQLASITAVGGGGGGVYSDRSGSAGGSGGGSGGEQSGGGIGGLGTATQGFGGGGTGIGRSGNPSSGSGGGGAGGVGGNNISGNSTAGSGGPGLLNAIDGNNYFYSGGGGGGNYNAGTASSVGGTGGNGGGGGGGSWGSSGGTPGQGNTTNRGQAGSGTNSNSTGTGGVGGPNTGGGGGGAGHYGIGGSGGSGIVIMRYSRQYAQNLQVSPGLTYYTIAVNNLEAATVFTSGIGTIQFLAGGLGGSGGESGELGINFLNDNQPANGRSGGRYGGGGSGGSDPTSIAGYTVSGGNGANGAVRIVYGTGVSFPSAATLDTTTGKALISQAEYPKIYSYSNPTKRDMLLISTLVPSLKGRSVKLDDIVLPIDNFSQSITTKNNIGTFTLQFLASAVSRGDVQGVLDVAKTLGFATFKAVMSEAFEIGVAYQGQRIEFFSIQGTKGTQLFYDITYMKKYPIIFWN